MPSNTPSHSRLFQWAIFCKEQYGISADLCPCLAQSLPGPEDNACQFPLRGITCQAEDEDVEETQT